MTGDEIAFEAGKKLARWLATAFVIGVVFGALALGAGVAWGLR